MTELISRKSAKNAIYKVCLDEGNKDIFVKILDEINKLSSIEQEPSGDLISREWLKTAIHNFYYGLIHTPTEEDIQAYIDVAPSVNPQEPKCKDCDYKEWLKDEIEPKTGHWISRPHIYGVAFCSECGYELKINNTNYCPNCGAKMVEPQESEG